MNKILRIFKHLAAARWQVRRHFPESSMNAIETAISASEKMHMGELRFVVEAALDWPELFSGMSSRERAIEVFSQLRIWDTELNSGVLIYLLLADHKVEIIADRGINARVASSIWQAICKDMEDRFHAGDFEGGVTQGISAISALLIQHFPGHTDNPNELPDHPTVL